MKSDTCIPIEKDSPDNGAFAANCSGAFRREESLLKQILRHVFVNVNTLIKTEGVQMPDVRSPGSINAIFRSAEIYHHRNSHRGSSDF